MPIYELVLTVALQIGIRNPIYSLPLENQVEVVEYIEKPLITETLVTPEPVSTLTKEAIQKPPQGDVMVLYANNTNNCVSYAKQQTGITHPLGNGGRSSIQGQEPRIGAIGVLKNMVHVVIVEDVANGLVTFRESNYRKNVITRRTLPESSFLGYIYE